MKNVVNKYILLIFPFLAVFGIPVKFGFFYLWPTELLVIYFGVIYLLNISVRRYKIYANNSHVLYIAGFAAILFCNIVGLIVGTEPERLTVTNLRSIARPVEIVLSVFVINTWIRSTVINKSIVLLSLAAAITSAGIAGLYGMLNNGFANTLISLYSPHLATGDLIGRFNMSIRAMSVFGGYDQASVTYSINLIIIIALMTLFKHSRAVMMIYNASFLVMFLSIVSSARTGAITTIAALPMYFVTVKDLNSIHRIRIIASFVLIIILAPVLANIIFPHSKTIKRFNDVFNIAHISSNTSVIERSEGLKSLYYTQIVNFNYPKGLDSVFGYGDNARPISDSGYVTTYIKYGLAGMLSLMILFSCWIIAALKTIYAAKNNRVGPEAVIFNIILACSSIIFIVAAIKGPLYFMNTINGDVLAYTLAFAIYENTSRQPNISDMGALH